MPKKYKTQHRLLGSGAPYVVNRETGNSYPLGDVTYGGNIATGGTGRAKCICGWVGPVRHKRQLRRDDYKSHEDENYDPFVKDYIKSRNESILGIVDQVEDEINSLDELQEIPVFMTEAEKRLYTALTPKVVRDLISRYRYQKR